MDDHAPTVPVQRGSLILSYKVMTLHNANSVEGLRIRWKYSIYGTHYYVNLTGYAQKSGTPGSASFSEPSSDSGMGNYSFRYHPVFPRSRFRRYIRKRSAGSGSYFLEPSVLVFLTILQFAAAGRDSACMPAGGIPEFSTRVNSQNPSNGSSSVNLPSNGSSSADLTHSVNCSSIESPARN